MPLVPTVSVNKLYALSAQVAINVLMQQKSPLSAQLVNTVTPPPQSVPLAMPVTYAEKAARLLDRSAEYVSWARTVMI